MRNRRLALGIKIPLNNVDTFCDECQIAKLNRHKAKFWQAKLDFQPGEYICSDICHMTARSREGYKYFVSFIDVVTRMA